MKQLTFEKPRTLRWWEVPEPVIRGPDEVIVRPFIAARCDGDSLFLRHDFEKALRFGALAHVIDSDFGSPHTDIFRGPFAYGHEGVAEVVQVGSAVKSFVRGDQVIVPWSVSCGACARCDQGLTAKCEDGSGHSPRAFGFGRATGEYGGMISDLLRVPNAEAMLVRVPSGVDPLSLASASDNLPDAYRSVGPALAQRPGAPVLVVGGSARSIGLYAAGIAVALGSTRVDYFDHDPQRLECAEAFGARAHAISSSLARLRARVGRRTVPTPALPRDGYPITVDASSTVRGLRLVLSATAPGGQCTGVGFYLRKNTGLPLWKMYMNDVTLRIGVTHTRPLLPALLPLIQSGAFDPNLARPLVADWSDAAEALLEEATKVVVRRAPLLAVT
jgi:threonine dehydrogenase-like Zn-dependent dehydrogenase